MCVPSVEQIVAQCVCSVGATVRGHEGRVSLCVFFRALVGQALSLSPSYSNPPSHCKLTSLHGLGGVGGWGGVCVCACPYSAGGG